MYYSETANFECIGFEPKKDFLQFAKNKIDGIFYFSPSDSILRAQLKKLDENFEGLIRITSENGVFLVRAFSKDIYRVIEMLCKKTQGQLNDWKSHRIFNNAEEPIPPQSTL